MKFVMISLVVFYSIASFSNTPISDPLSLLKQVDEFIQSKTFDLNFQCGQVTRYYSYVDDCEIYCEDFMCITNCLEIDEVTEREVAECSENEVVVYGDDGSITTYTEENYVEQKSNVARIFLSKLGEFIRQPGSITLTETKETQYTVNGVDGDYVVKAMHLMGEYKFDNFVNYDQTMPFLITVGQGLPGEAALIRFRMEEATWFRLKNYEVLQ